MVHKAKVFGEHQCYTEVHNALFDVVMPDISGSALKVLYLIIRQTNGWERDDAGLSYEDIMQGTGIASRTTVSNAVQELLNYRYKLIKVVPGVQHQKSKYTINRDAEVDWVPRNMGSTNTSSGTKTGLLSKSSSPENGLLSGTETGLLSKSSSPENGLINRKEDLLIKGKKKKEDSAHSRRSPAPASPDHNHPAVKAYREILSYKKLLAAQATMIGQVSGFTPDVVPQDWVNFLTDLAETGYQYPSNVKVVVVAFKLWRRGVHRKEALRLAWIEVNGEDDAPVVRKGKVAASSGVLGDMDIEEFAKQCVADAARKKNKPYIDVEV